MGNVMGKAFDMVSKPFIDAHAANIAEDKLDEAKDLRKFKSGEKDSKFFEVGSAIGDKAMDVANIATLGMVRRVANVFEAEDEKVEYKNLSAARKAGEIDNSASAEDRARYLASRAVNELDVRTDAQRAADAKAAEEEAAQVSDGAGI